MRDKIVAGNWKMNLSHGQAMELATEVIGMTKDEVKSTIKVVLIPPFVHLYSLHKLVGIATKNIFLGAQNCHHLNEGAYTGEVSASMLTAYKTEYVIIGHSERRQYFGETDTWLAQKVKNVLQNGMKPIFCCGESLDIRENGDYRDFIGNQIEASLWQLSPEEFSKLVIAYEPIWAIGTGKNATAEQAQEVHAFIRNKIAQKFGQDIAQRTSILYGGSCKPSNAKELFACPDVDGGLIGGASLKSRDFVDIAKSF